MTIASMKQQGLECSASTVSRWLARNTGPVVGYACAEAQALRKSRREAGRPCSKLHPQSVSWRVVLTLLDFSHEVGADLQRVETRRYVENQGKEYHKLHSDHQLALF
jgi:hypothetical protein